MKKFLTFVLCGAMVLSLVACGNAGAGQSDTASDSTHDSIAAAPTQTAAPEPTVSPEPTAEPEPTTTPAPEPPADAEDDTDGTDAVASDDVPGVSPEFKEVMDSYEAFFDEYAAFMEKYQSSDDSASMLMDYLSFLSRYAEATQKLEEIDTDSLSAADMAYYTQVMARIATILAGAVT